MPRNNKDEPPAVRVYTVCDESKYLIVRNVPALGCGDELLKAFSNYGEVEECKPMDAEECEEFTDIYCIKFRKIDNARFAKRKLDEFVFLGNRLQVSYAPQFESLLDTKEKLETRRNEVLARLNPNARLSKRDSGTIQGHSPMDDSALNFRGREIKDYGNVVTSGGSVSDTALSKRDSGAIQSHSRVDDSPLNFREREFRESGNVATSKGSVTKAFVSSDKYFPSESMNQTVRMVRERLDKIQQSGGSVPETGQSKRARVDNRRRI
ncbi:OLC1v1029950C1 [Oldenlandia corymbosa var. corymbosa]|uniref:RNA-binding protein 48 n=1 Tax=Oldenlandia corymbosa var. corymbosa TaxID=529605 RepID=A0AAV1CGH1_OLDCO|nr:OLC1v1029950C1 [Oldenlandia corymbosa var. corymbosa]